MMTNALAALDALLLSVDFAYLTIVQGEDRSPPLYRLSFRRDNKSHTAVACTLEELLDAASNNPGMKVCSRCGECKPFAAFPRAPVRKDRPEGRHSHCKICDRQRKKKYSRRRRPLTNDAPAAQAV